MVITEEIYAQKDDVTFDTPRVAEEDWPMKRVMEQAPAKRRTWLPETARGIRDAVSKNEYFWLGHRTVCPS